MIKNLFKLVLGISIITILSVGLYFKFFKISNNTNININKSPGVIVSENQQGGITANVVNVIQSNPQKHFNDTMASELNKYLPKDKKEPVAVSHKLGSIEAEQLAEEIENYLISMGYLEVHTLSSIYKSSNKKGILIGKEKGLIFDRMEDEVFFVGVNY
ncbi:MAG: hypothetical protein ABH836_01630 [Candidatus Omnitrophota bacterium]